MNSLDWFSKYFMYYVVWPLQLAMMWYIIAVSLFLLFFLTIISGSFWLGYLDVVLITSFPFQKKKITSFLGFSVCLLSDSSSWWIYTWLYFFNASRLWDRAVLTNNRKWKCELWFTKRHSFAWWINIIQWIAKQMRVYKLGRR